MSAVGWHSFTVKLADDAAQIKVKPLAEQQPMGLQLLTISHDTGSTVTLVLNVDQADQLEHELERARWHRVFMQRQLADQVTDGTDTTEETPEQPTTITKPDDAHSGGWEATLTP